MLRDPEQRKFDSIQIVWEEQLTFVGGMSWSGGGGLLLLGLFRSGGSACNFLGRHCSVEELN